jgi:methionine-rich copper-binding protein CopC
MKTWIALAGLAALSSLAFAHSTIKSAVPADHAHVKTAPKTVSLSFDEKFAASSAVFKVYYLPESAMMKNGKMMNPGQMDDVAEATMNKYVSAKTDTSARVDAGMVKATSSSVDRVVINLKPNLKPGVYVTMWSLKAADGDSVKGFIHFHLDRM